MGVRNDKEIIDQLMAKYGVLWSISRLKNYETCPYQYYLQYILKLENNANAYGVQGGNAHDTLEEYYTGKIKLEDLSKVFLERFIKSSHVDDVKFPKGDKEEEKWLSSVNHFMKTHNPIQYKKIEIETLIVIRLNDHCFRGYIDVIYQDEDGKVAILDWKTSTMFRGKDIKKNGKQLILYKLAAEHTYGVKIDKLAWNMLKYCNIEYEVNGAKHILKNIERCTAANEIVKVMRKYTQEKDFGIKDILFDRKKENWEVFPEYSSYNFKFSDCIVEYVPDEEDVRECIESLVSDIETILSKGNVKEFFPVKNKGSFFCTALCGHAHQCHD